MDDLDMAKIQDAVRAGKTRAPMERIYYLPYLAWHRDKVFILKSAGNTADFRWLFDMGYL